MARQLDDESVMICAANSKSVNSLAVRQELSGSLGPYSEKILEHALHIAVLESGSSATDFEYVIGIQEAFQAQS